MNLKQIIASATLLTALGLSGTALGQTPAENAGKKMPVKAPAATEQRLPSNTMQTPYNAPLFAEDSSAYWGNEGSNEPETDTTSDPSTCYQTVANSDWNYELGLFWNEPVCGGGDTRSTCPPEELLVTPYDDGTTLQKFFCGGEFWGDRFDDGDKTCIFEKADASGDLLNVKYYYGNGGATVYQVSPGFTCPGGRSASPVNNTNNTTTDYNSNFE